MELSNLLNAIDNFDQFENTFFEINASLDR